jgi:hypothetical protein
VDFLSNAPVLTQSSLFCYPEHLFRPLIRKSVWRRRNQSEIGEIRQKVFPKPQKQILAGTIKCVFLTVLMAAGSRGIVTACHQGD